MSQIALSPPATGTGVFTISAPATNTNRTLTLPDATGTVLTTATPGVPINGPAFSAVPTSASQTPSINTFTKVTLGTEVFDTNNSFDTANSRFQPAVAGYYQVNGTVGLNGTTTRLLMSLFKNGGEYTRGFDIQSNCSSGTSSAVIYLNGSTDYVELYVYISSSVAIYHLGCTQLSAALIRSAL